MSVEALRVMPYERVVFTHRAVGGSLGYSSSLDQNNVVLTHLYRLGDANLDTAVDIADFSTLAVNFNRTGRDWFGGDFTGDQAVNIGDFALLAANFNQTSGEHRADRSADDRSSRPRWFGNRRHASGRIACHLPVVKSDCCCCSPSAVGDPLTSHRP